MLLRYGMAELMKVAQDGGREQPYPQVHAFNCIRLIVMDKELSTRLSGFIAEGACPPQLIPDSRKVMVTLDAESDRPPPPRPPVLLSPFCCATTGLSTRRLTAFKLPVDCSDKLALLQVWRQQSVRCYRRIGRSATRPASLMPAWSSA